MVSITLPSETYIVNNIFVRLPVKDILMVSQVCKAWNIIAKGEEVWQSKYREYKTIFPDRGPNGFDGTKLQKLFFLYISDFIMANQDKPRWAIKLTSGSTPDFCEYFFKESCSVAMTTNNIPHQYKNLTADTADQLFKASIQEGQALAVIRYGEVDFFRGPRGRMSIMLCTHEANHDFFIWATNGLHGDTVYKLVMNRVFGDEHRYTMHFGLSSYL